MVIRFTDALSLEERFELGQLHQAAADGNLAEIQRLAQTHHLKLINVFDELSLTPLMRAAMGGHVEAVKLLLAAGADVNAHDERRVGNTALNEVAGDGSAELVATLTSASVQPDELDAVVERLSRLPGVSHATWESSTSE